MIDFKVKSNDDIAHKEWKKIQEIVSNHFDDETDDYFSNKTKILIYLSLIRIKFFIALFKKLIMEFDIVFKGKDIVDLGCGTGFLLRLVDTYSPHTIIGVDKYYSALNLAKILAPRIEQIHTDIYDFIEPDSKRKFDIVLCTEVLEHCVYPGHILRKALGILKDSGTLVITVPDGRNDNLEAGHPPNDESYLGASYTGHINFWSPENFKLFLAQEIPGVLVKTSIVNSQQDRILAIIHKGCPDQTL